MTLLPDGDIFFIVAIVTVNEVSTGVTKQKTLELLRYYFLMEHYLYVSSEDSLDFYPDNTPHHFKIHLRNPLQWRGFWKTGLIEFHAASTGHVTSKTIKTVDSEMLYVFCKVGKESMVHGQQLPVLRKMHYNMLEDVNYVYESPIYVPVKKEEVYDLEFVIKMKNGCDPVSVENVSEPTSAFQSFSFLRRLWKRLSCMCQIHKNGSSFTRTCTKDTTVLTWQTTPPEGKDLWFLSINTRRMKKLRQIVKNWP